VIAGLLFAVFFETPLAAAGAAGAAVSIPIIIHLLNRRRFRIVEWAAMRFLLAAQKKNSRKMRIEQLLLLLVRCLIVLLLALAMCSVTEWAERLWRWANPAGGKGMITSATRTHKILVLDGSYSMGARAGDASFFEKARALASEAAESGTSGDAYSVVLMASPPRRIVPEPSEDGRRVASEIRSLRATHGNADLSGTLATVAGLLKSSPGKFPAKEVYFFTDMQKSGWLSPRPGDLAGALSVFKQSGAKAIFVDVGQEGLSNLTVTSLEMGDPVTTTVHESRILATIFNHGETQSVNVRFSVGKAREKASQPQLQLRQAAEVPVQARKGHLTPVAFTYRFPEPGDWVIQVTAGHDALAVDDTRSAVVRVRNDVPVLLVNGKPSPDPFSRATEWLRIALNPFEDSPPPGVTARPRVLTPAQFANATTGSLDGVDAVFLCDVPRLSSDEARRLEAHVRQGGAALFVVGPNVDIGAWNDTLWKDGKGLLPAELEKKVQAPAGSAFRLTVPPDGDRLDPLRLFQDLAAREKLVQPAITQYIHTRPLKATAGERPRVVLGFSLARVGAPDATASPAGPAMIEWRPPLPGKPAGEDANGEERSPGRGRVVLITTTASSDWGNWPVSQSFPALMSEVMGYAAAARLRERALLCGDPLELYLGAMKAGAVARVEAPRDSLDPSRDDDLPRAVPITAQGDGSVMRYTDTDISGLYRVTVGGLPTEHLFAVNPPSASEDQLTSESNLARVSQEELERAFPDWDLQVVTGLTQVKHASPASIDSSEVSYAPQGPPIAHALLIAALVLILTEVVLAWRFGHYSATGSLPQEGPPPRPGLAQYALWASPWVLFGLLAGVAFTLVHERVTGDFLGFLPESVRSFAERSMNVPPPAMGEGSIWRLEYSSYFSGPKADPWLAGALLVAAGVAIAFIYRNEGNDVSAAFRALLVSLRVGILVLMLLVFLPQLRLYFERQGWPDVVLLIDDSHSMSHLDAYVDEKVKAAADALAEKADLTAEESEEVARMTVSKTGLTRASRLRLAQTLFARGDDWLRELIERRKVRLHVYRFASRPQRLETASESGEAEKLGNAIRSLRAAPEHDSTQVGAAIRQVLADFRGSSLAAVVVATDGVSTDSRNDIEQAGKHAGTLNVPLMFVGIGGSHEPRDLELHDLQAPDAVYVNDRINFKLKLTARGFDGLTVPVALYEKGSEKPLDTRPVTIPRGKRTVDVTVAHRPTEPGEKTYVIRVPVQEGEVVRENNQIEKTVYARESKLLRVLYIEGYRRYEYHYLKTLLERESARVKGNKTVDLRVVLLDADQDATAQDRTMLSGLPAPVRGADTHTDKDDLWSYDVVILGDVDPEPARGRFTPQQMGQLFKDLAEWVMDRGGGLIVLAGERHSPHAYRNGPLKDVLPIDVVSDQEDDDEALTEGFRPELAPAGRGHPMFRFHPEERESEEAWGQMKELFWYSRGYVPKRAAEALATHPTARGGGKGPEKHPLVVQHQVGAGRCLFLGISETWRWGWREDQAHYNRFWIEAIRYLARSKVDRIELRLDRQTPYRRGEPIKVTVRFPDDEKPPPEKLEVKVSYERSPIGKPSEKESRFILLTHVPGTRGTYEATLTQTPEGEYRFALTSPEAKPKPRAECKVLAPPGEMEDLRMNEEEMRKAAELSGGKFFTLETAGKLIDELPSGNRVTVNAPGPPVNVWTSWVLFLLAIGLFTSEWLLRKTKNLL
jgi:hypothetical protein